MTIREFRAEEDLLKLISDQETESLHLDFKASDALKKDNRSRNELAKDAAAMATAEGGVLLYGVVEDDATRVAKSIDRGFNPLDISKEWIEQVIADNVSPHIEGIRIIPIELRTTNPGRYAYAVAIPSSHNAPHMANYRYYMRLNFQSVPMDDYLVRAIMFRRRTPSLELQYFTTPSDGIVVLNFWARNVGLVPAEGLYFEVEFFLEDCEQHWTPRDIPPATHLRNPDARLGQKAYILAYSQTEAPAPSGYPSPRRVPVLYPGVTFKFDDMQLPIRKDAPSDHIIKARLYSRDMPIVEKSINISSLFKSG